MTDLPSTNSELAGVIEDNENDKEQLLVELSALRRENAQLRKLQVEPMQAEKVLQESEQKYKNFADQLPETVVEFDENGKFTFVNRDGLKAFGYTMQDIERGLNVLQTMAPEGHDRAKENIAKVVWGGESSGNEYTMVKKDGSRFPAFIHGNAVVRDNKVVGVRAIVVDISERKRTEEALRRAEEECRRERDRATEYLNIAGVMLLALDREGRVTMLNRKGHELLGYEEGELAGKDWVSTCLPVRARDEMTHAFSKLINKDLDPVECYENRVLTKQGEERNIAWHNTLLKDQAGNITGSLSSGEDVTERKIAEQALRESEERFRILAETVQEVFWMADIWTNRTFYVSPGYEQMWGRSRQSLYDNPKSFAEAIHPEDRTRALAQFEVKEAGQSFDLEYRIVLPDGSIRWIWDRGFPIQSEAGEVTRYAGIATDITDRKKTEVILREHKARLDLALQSAGMGTWHWDVVGNRRYFDDQVCRLLAACCPTPALTHSPAALTGPPAYIRHFMRSP